MGKPITKKDVNKSITPTIVSYDTLYDEFENGLKFKPALSDKGISRPLLEERRRILDVLTKHKDALSEIEDAILDLIQKSVRMNPPVYIAKTKDPKTEKVYFNAKTFIPLKGGKKKEVKVYLGSASLYGNDTKSPLAKTKAIEKLQKAIADKAAKGEFKN
jgi:hypothetical protein